MPAHKLNAVSGVGRRALALKPYPVPGVGRRGILEYWNDAKEKRPKSS